MSLATSRKKLYGILRGFGLPLNRSDFRIRSFKNKYLGKRCFIVGSGPSMKMEYFPFLENEYTFSANQIFRCFPLTSWRPNFYLIADSHIAEIHKDSILKSDLRLIFASKHLAHLFCNDPRVIRFNKTHESYTNQRPPFSSNPLFCVEGGYTVSYLAMQIAWYMGFRKIYTLGIDASYAPVIEQHINSGQSDDVYKLVMADNRKSYFMPNIVDKDELTFMPLPQRQLLAYESAKEFINSRGGVICNAADDSPLEVFPRVDFDSLF